MADNNIDDWEEINDWEELPTDNLTPEQRQAGEQVIGGIKQQALEKGIQEYAEVTPELAPVLPAEPERGYIKPLVTGYGIPAAKAVGSALIHPYDTAGAIATSVSEIPGKFASAIKGNATIEDQAKGIVSGFLQAVPGANISRAFMSAVVNSLAEGKGGFTEKELMDIYNATAEKEQAEITKSPLGQISEAITGALLPIPGAKTIGTGIAKAADLATLPGREAAKTAIPALGRTGQKILEKKALSYPEATKELVGEEGKAFRESLGQLEVAPEKTLPTLTSKAKVESDNIIQQVKEALPLIQQSEGEKAAGLARKMKADLRNSIREVGKSFENALDSVTEESGIHGRSLATSLKNDIAGSKFHIQDAQLTKTINQIIDGHLSELTEKNTLGEMAKGMYGIRKELGVIQRHADDASSKAAIHNVLEFLDNKIESFAPDAKPIYDSFKPLYQAENAIDSATTVRKSGISKDRIVTVPKIQSTVKSLGSQYAPEVGSKLQAANLPEEQEFIKSAKLSAEPTKLSNRALTSELPQGLQDSLLAATNAERQITPSMNVADKARIYEAEFRNAGLQFGDTKQDKLLLNLIEKHGNTVSDLINKKVAGESLTSAEEVGARALLNRILRNPLTMSGSTAAAIGGATALGGTGAGVLAVLATPIVKMVQVAHAAGHNPLDSLYKYAKTEAKQKAAMEALYKLPETLRNRTIEILDNPNGPKTSLLINALSRGWTADKLGKLIEEKSKEENQ